MKKEKIIGSAFVKNLTFTTIKQGKSSNLFAPITTYINHKRNQTFQNIYNKVPTHVGDLIGLIFFGYKQNIEPNKLMALRTLYLKWGLSHYLARSGLHIVILFGLLNFLLSFLYIPYRSKKIILLLFCLIYTVLSWTSISYLRALILIVLCMIAQLNKLQLSLLHLINLACFAILLWNPQQLFSLDFQLSFALTYSLILMNLLIQIPPTPLPQALQKSRPVSSSHT